MFLPCKDYLSEPLYSVRILEWLDSNAPVPAAQSQEMAELVSWFQAATKGRLKSGTHLPNLSRYDSDTAAKITLLIQKAAHYTIGTEKPAQETIGISTDLKTYLKRAILPPMPYNLSRIVPAKQQDYQVRPLGKLEESTYADAVRPGETKTKEKTGTRMASNVDRILRNVERFPTEEFLHTVKECRCQF